MKKKVIAFGLSVASVFTFGSVYAKSGKEALFECNFERLDLSGFCFSENKEFEIVSDKGFSGMFSAVTENDMYYIPICVEKGKRYVFSVKWKSDDEAELDFTVDGVGVKKHYTKKGEWNETIAIYEAETSETVNVSTRLTEEIDYYIDDLSISGFKVKDIKIEGSEKAARGQSEKYDMYLVLESGEVILYDNYICKISGESTSSFYDGELVVSEDEKLGELVLEVECEGLKKSKSIEIFDEIEHEVSFDKGIAKLSLKNMTDKEKTINVAAGVFWGDSLEKIIKYETVSLRENENKIITLGEQEQIKVFIWQDMKPKTVSGNYRASENVIYVSAQGSDENDGTFKNPFRTLEAARDKMRKMEVPEGGVTVFIRGGIYYRDSEFILNAKDSGSKDKPIRYMAYPGETPVFTQGIELDLNMAEKVYDNSVLSKLPDDNAREHLYSIDLTLFGIDNLSKQDYIGAEELNSWIDRLKGTAGQARFEKASVTPANEVFFDGEPLKVARFPNNDEWICLNDSKDLIDAGATPRYWEDNMIGNGNYVEQAKRDINHCFTIKYDDRVDRWVDAKDALLMGFWYHNWSVQSVGIGKIDTENNYITSDRPSYYGVRAGIKDYAKFYIYNLIEELDSKGEYYFDRDELKLYFYRSDDMTDDKKLWISTGNISFLNVYNVSDIVFDGLEFNYGTGTGVKLSGNNIVFKNCTIKNVPSQAMTVVGENNHVSECTIENVDGGVYLYSNGSYENDFEHANSKIEKCTISDFSRRSLVYKPAITLGGVGNSAENNKISGSYHMAVSLGGMDNLLKGNEIFDVCRMSSDAGTVYMGRSWTKYDNKVIGNYFHDLTPDPAWASGLVVNAVYADDLYGGLTVSGNIFENIDGYAVKLNGGYDHVIENNIFINCSESGELDGGSVVISRYGAEKDTNQDYVLAVNCTEHLAGLVSSGYLNACWEDDAHAKAEIKTVGGVSEVDVTPIENFVLFMKSEEWKENEQENIAKYINSAWHEKYPEIYEYISQNAGETYNNIYRNNILVNSDGAKKHNMTDERFSESGNSFYKGDILSDGLYRTVDYSKVNVKEQSKIRVTTENMGIEGVFAEKDFSEQENETGLVIDDECSTIHNFGEYCDELSEIAALTENETDFIRLEGKRAKINNNYHAGMIYNLNDKSISFKKDEVITIDTRLRYKLTSVDGSNAPYILLKMNMPENVSQIYKTRIYSQKVKKTSDGTLSKYPEKDENGEVLFAERGYQNQSYDATLAGFLNGKYSYPDGYANGANAYCSAMKWTNNNKCNSLDGFSEWIRVVVTIDKMSGLANYKFYDCNNILFDGFTETGKTGRIANMPADKTLETIGFGVINAARGDIIVDVDYIKIAVDKK